MDHQQEVALDNCILKAVVGSKLYGTDTPESDEDYTGIFIPDKEMVFGLNECDQVSFSTQPSHKTYKNTAEDKDITYYSVKRFFHLAVKNNPNILELFFLPEKNILIKTEWWQRIADMYSAVISKRVFGSFFGYATAQEHLMETKTRRYNAVVDAEIYLKKLLQKGDERLTEDTLLELMGRTKNYRNKQNQEREYQVGQPLPEIYDHILRELNSYGHRKENIIKFSFETKFSSHLIRLLDEGTELALTGRIEYPLKSRDLIRSIKLGEVTYEGVKALVKERKEAFRQAEVSSVLPANPDFDKINKLLVELTEDYLAYKATTNKTTNINYVYKQSHK